MGAKCPRDRPPNLAARRRFRKRPWTASAPSTRRSQAARRAPWTRFRAWARTCRSPRGRTAVRSRTSARGSASRASSSSRRALGRDGLSGDPEVQQVALHLFAVLEDLQAEERDGSRCVPRGSPRDVHCPRGPSPASPRIASLLVLAKASFAHPRVRRATPSLAGRRASTSAREGAETAQTARIATHVLGAVSCMERSAARRPRRSATRLWKKLDHAGCELCIVSRLGSDHHKPRLALSGCSRNSSSGLWTRVLIQMFSRQGFLMFGSPPHHHGCLSS